MSSFSVTMRTFGFPTSSGAFRRAVSWQIGLGRQRMAVYEERVEPVTILTVAAKRAEWTPGAPFSALV